MDQQPGAAVTFTGFMNDVALVFEGIGAAILVGGLVWSAATAWMGWRQTGSGAAIYDAVRRTFGRALLLGLEILVAADLIRTVAVSPSIENVVVLGLIVLIRTFLSFSLDVEIDGTLPWRRALLGKTPAGARAPSPARLAGNRGTGHYRHDAPE